MFIACWKPLCKFHPRLRMHCLDTNSSTYRSQVNAHHYSNTRAKEEVCLVKRFFGGRAVLALAVSIYLIASLVSGVQLSSAMPDVLRSELNLTQEQANIVRGQERLMRDIGVVLKKIESTPALAERFGGYYSDSEGNLVLAFTEDVDPYKEFGLKTALVKRVKFSLQYLNEVQDAISNMVKASHGRHDLKIAATSVDMEANRVVVWVDDMDEAVLGRIKRMVGSEALEFKKQEGEFTTASDIVNGHFVGVVNSTERASIGFRVRRRLGAGFYQNGFISTGHFVAAEGSKMADSVNKGGPWQYVGRLQRKVRSGSVDASFISAASGRTPTKRFMNHASYAYVLQDTTVGRYVEV